MEQKKITAQTLAAQIDTIKDQEIEFIEKYIKALLTTGRYYRFDKRLTVYLPYVGNDEDVIFNLFQVFVRYKYPEFKLDKISVDVISFLIKIMLKKTDKPGLILWGTVGSGKTTLLLIWLEFRMIVMGSYSGDRLDYQRFFEEKKMSIIQHSPTGLESKFSKEGHDFFDKGSGVFGANTAGELMLIDDFGIAPIVNYYGQKVNVLEHLIYSRYNIFKSCPGFEFYATTNYLKKELDDIIGQRASSRLMEMAEWDKGKMVCSDKRKNKVLRYWPDLSKYTPQNQSVKSNIPVIW